MQDLSVDPWLLVDAGLAFTDPRLGELVAYWRGKQADDRLPSRDVIDPLDLRQLMGHLFLVDVAGEPAQWRYRLVGTHITDRAGADGTGKTIDTIFGPDYAPPVVRAYAHVVTRHTPLRFFGRLRWQARDYLTYEAVLLPLADNGRDVDKLFGAMIIRSAAR